MVLFFIAESLQCACVTGLFDPVEVQKQNALNLNQIV